MDLRTSGAVEAGAAKDPHLRERDLLAEETNAIREVLARQAAKATRAIRAQETNQGVVLGSPREAVVLEQLMEAQISGQMGTIQPTGVKWHRPLKL